MKKTLSIRQEANALTAIVFRNGFLEHLHSGAETELISDPHVSRISDEEMKQLMVETSAKLSELMALRDSDVVRYRQQITWAHEVYARHWDTETSHGVSVQNRERLMGSDTDEDSATGACGESEPRGGTGCQEAAFLSLLKQYGRAMEAFGAASTGSPGGMEATMGYAQGAIRELLFAVLGREPTAGESALFPPLSDPVVTTVALRDIVADESGGDDDGGSIH